MSRQPRPDSSRCDSSYARYLKKQGQKYLTHFVGRERSCVLFSRDRGDLHLFERLFVIGTDIHDFELTKIEFQNTHFVTRTVLIAYFQKLSQFF